jgi:NAD/NADP transhydrogenase alpha subunit
MMIFQFANCNRLPILLKFYHKIGFFFQPSVIISVVISRGKYPPSQTFVLGCGVAGLAAIGTSKAMGSAPRISD